jgi:hypothetical protein
MKKAILCLLIFSSSFLKAQDSIPEKRIRHELGFNSVLLIKQIFSNNPNATLPQLPYQVIYTLHFKNKLGVRAGLGITQTRTETAIEGLSSPRITKELISAYRLGINKDFLTYRHITANAFADVVTQQASLSTETETNSGSFSSRQTIDSKIFSVGPEIGFGIKYTFNKHIALYTEIPLQFLYTTSHETDVTTNDNSGSSFTETQISNSKGYATKIFLPTTLFLNILF